VPPSVAARLRTAESGGLEERARVLLPIVLWVALVCALSGPRVLVQSPALHTSGRDLILALDLSGSMEKGDFELDGIPARRLDAVKRTAVEFVRRREGDRVGLVIFSEKAYFAAPPTYDVESVARAVEEATIGLSGRSTSISEGLGLALKRLSESKARTRVVILLSDGINTAGAVAPVQAAEYASRLGIRVHTIALGPQDTGDPDAATDVVDAETLGSISEASGGRTFRVRTTADLESVARSLDGMEPTPDDDRAGDIQRELWIYPATAALAAALLLLLLRRVP
jgi:Ca-activated chloride channel family protein